MSATASPHRPLAAIDRHVAQEILYDVLDTVSPRNEDTEEQRNNRDAATLTMLDHLNPRNTLEAMVAAHVVASHYAAMHSFRVAMETDRRDKNLTRIRNCAAGLSRLFFQAVALLKKLQAENAPPKQATSAASATPANPLPAAAANPAATQPPANATIPTTQPTVGAINATPTRTVQPPATQTAAASSANPVPPACPNTQSPRSNSA